MPAEPSQAVFLSYASQDAEAARRLCETLRAEGVEVWFDADGGLEHGDEWDAKIRRQIKECVLFIPVISANTQARHEGYFRIEWDLAAERARGIASGVAFILPVVIDDTREPEALVPDRFRMVQWTKLPGGVVSPEVKARYLKLWSHRIGAAKSSGVEPGRPRPGERGEGVASPTQVTANRRVPAAAWIASIAAVAAVVGFIALRPKPNDGPGTRPPAAEKPAGPVSESKRLVAKAWEQLNKPEMARIELNTAEGFCKRAAELDDSDAEVWAAWSQVNTWFVYYQLESTLARREAARDYAARAMRLAPRSFEARLAQACYWMRGEGLDVGFVGDEKPPLYAAEAERLLRELHAEQPDEPRTLLMLGFVRVWKDTTLPARYDLLERAARNPAFAAEAWKEIGWVKFFQGDPNSAVSAAERSIAAQPTWNNLWLKTLLATVWLGDLDLAKTTLERMPAAALQEDVGLYLTYWVYVWRHEPLLALGQLERQPRDWLRMSGYIGPKALLTGKLRLMANQPEAARRDFLRARELVEQALATDQNNRHLLSLRAQALHFLDEKEEAQRTYRLAHDLGARGPELESLFTPPEAFFDWADRHIDSLQDRPNTVWLFTAAAVRHAPYFAPLHSHPRYPALLARLEADPRFSPKAKAVKAVAAPAPDSKSVAVLAFANLSDDKTNEYFSDGIAEELLTTLQRIPGLKVAARTSAWSFKGKNPTALEVGEKLGKAHVVEGSVQKIGSRVKITARLSRAATNEELWSKSFGPLELTDVFATQSEIAQAIVGELRGRLTGEAAATARSEIASQVQAAQRGGTKNAAALEFYLRGRSLYSRGTSADVAQSITFFEQAIAADRDFAAAWAAVARARVWQGSFEPLVSERFRQARAAAAQALAIEPNLPEGHSAMSQVLQRHFFEWKKAREASARAVQLAPDNADVLTDACTVGQSFGDWEHSLAAGRRAVSLDPLNPEPRLFLAISFFHSGRLPEAETEIRRACELAPTGHFLRLIACQILLEAGRPTEALAEARKEPARMHLLQGLALAEFAGGRRNEADAALKALESEFADSCPFQIAEVYAARNEPTAAFKWLDHAWQVREGGIGWVRVAKTLKNLHGDPRWQDFLRKVGLHDEQLK